VALLPDSVVQSDPPGHEFPLDDIVRARSLRRENHATRDASAEAHISYRR
jgi:hypothetical protein